jgi:phosphomannomutase
MDFPSHIFKAYDIRGLAESELSEDLAYRLGRSFVVFLRSKKMIRNDQVVVVGRDMRPSSPVFAEAVTKGIHDEGVNVVDIGLTSTPLFNFACAHYDAHAGGIMVTASHNPAEYNGFKLTLGNALPIGKNSGMDAIHDLVEKNEFNSAKGSGTVSFRDVLPDYFSRIFALVKPETIKPLRVVVDAGNGMADVTIPKLLKRLPVTTEYLFLEPDGTFPNHEANPLKVETLRELQKRVVETGADFGFALDGDADRIGLVDELGQVVDASFVGALIGLEVLRNHPKAHMLYDLRSSQIVRETWEKSGATTEMCMVGHALIKKMMAEDKRRPAFASELSLHLYFHDMYNVESSDLALLYILQLLSRQSKKLSELVGPLKKYSHSGEINFKVSDKDAVLTAIRYDYLSSAKTVTELDGLHYAFPWGWFNVRASNTEPVLRLNLEATTKEKMNEELIKLKKLIR